MGHPCPQYRNAGISNIINPNGWKIETQTDFKLLGITYSFEFSYSDIYTSYRNKIDQQYQDPTKVLISFTGKSWIAKNTPGPDPRSAAANALSVLHLTTFSIEFCQSGLFSCQEYCTFYIVVLCHLEFYLRSKIRVTS